MLKGQFLIFQGKGNLKFFFIFEYPIEKEVQISCNFYQHVSFFEIKAKEIYTCDDIRSYIKLMMALSQYDAVCMVIKERDVIKSQ